MKLRFINTYEPVTSIYRDLIPHLAKHGFSPQIVISKAEYRQARENLDKEAIHNSAQISKVRISSELILQGQISSMRTLRGQLFEKQFSVMGPLLEPILLERLLERHALLR